MKQKKVVIAFVLLLALVLSVAFTACGKQEVGEEAPELVNPEVFVADLMKETGYQENYSFARFPKAEDFHSEAGTALVATAIDEFAVNLAEAGYPKEKSDKLIDAATNYVRDSISAPSAPTKRISPTYYLNKLGEIVSAFSDSGMTASDTSTVITCLYKAFVSVYNDNNYYGRLVDAAKEYIADIDTYLAGADNQLILTYIKNNAKLLYVDRCLNDDPEKPINYLGVDDENNVFLSEKQYGEIRAIINTVENDCLPDLATAKAEIDNEENEYSSLLDYARKRVALIDLDSLAENTFKKEADAFNKINNKQEEFYFSEWYEVFTASGCNPQSAEAYKYIDEFFNGIPADAAKGIEKEAGYKEICPDTVAVIPADYTGLTAQWLISFETAFTHDYCKAERYKNINNGWYTNAYAITEYIKVYDKTAEYVEFPASLDAAVLAVIQPTIEIAFKLNNAVSSIKDLFNGDESFEKSDIDALLDSIDAVVDELVAFADDNGTKVKALTGELRAFAKELGAYTLLEMCDVLDSFVNIAPDIAKIVKIITASMTPEVIDAFEAGLDFFDKYYEDEGVDENTPFVNLYIASAKLINNILTNPAIDTADEVMSLVESIIDKCVGTGKATILGMIGDEIDFYPDALDDFDTLLSKYYESFSIKDMEDLDEFMEDLYEDSGISEGALSSISVYPWIYVKEEGKEGEYTYTEASLKAFRADILNVANLYAVVSKKAVLEGFEDIFVEPLYEGIVTYWVEYNPETDENIYETKTAIEIIEVIANIPPAKTAYLAESGEPAFSLLGLYDYFDIACYATGNDMIPYMLSAMSNNISMYYYYNIVDSYLNETVEAVFADGSLKSDKELVIYEIDKSIEFVYTADYDNFIINICGDVLYSSNFINFYIVDEDGNYSYYCNCVGASYGEIKPNKDLIPGFKYAAGIDSYYIDTENNDAIIVYLEYYDDVKFEITFDEPATPGEVVLESNTVEILLPNYDRDVEVFFNYKEIEGYGLILKFNDEDFDHIDGTYYDPDKDGYIYYELEDGERVTVSYLTLNAYATFSLEYIPLKEITFEEAELTSDVVTVAAGERADVSFTYVEKAGYSIKLICSDENISLYDFDADKIFTDGETYTIFCDNDGEDAITFSLEYYLSEQELTFAGSALVSNTATVKPDENVEVSFTYVEKSGYRVRLICSDTSITLSDFGAGENLVNSTVYSYSLDNDGEDAVTFSLEYYLIERKLSFENSDATTSNVVTVNPGERVDISFTYVEKEGKKLVISANPNHSVDLSFFGIPETGPVDGTTYSRVNYLNSTDTVYNFQLHYITLPALSD